MLIYFTHVIQRLGALALVFSGATMYALAQRYEDTFGRGSDVVSWCSGIGSTCLIFGLFVQREVGIAEGEAKYTRFWRAPR